MQEQITATAAEPQVRRGFLQKFLAIIVGGLAVLAPFVPGAAVVLDPVLRRRQGGDGATGNNELAGFLPVTSLSAVPADGMPRRFPVLADRVDAWTKQAAVPVGAVYLRRTDDNNVAALNVVCPHLGCAVRTEADGHFTCPCHDSEFDTTGKIIPVTRHGTTTVAQRDLDSLEVRIIDGQVFVKFQNFRAAIREKVPV